MTAARPRSAARSKEWKPITRLDAFYQDDGEPRRVGGLVLAGDGGIHFQYDSDWLKSGLELSPRQLPLSLGTAVVAAPDPRKLHGLHGVFADALPDTWGIRVLTSALRRHGIDPARAGSLDRLAFLGARTMGALTFRPAGPIVPPQAHDAVTLDSLAEDAEEVEAGVGGGATTSESRDGRASDAALDAFEHAAGSPGGRQPKVLLAARANDGALVAGDARETGYMSYLLKFTPRQDGLGLRTDCGVLEEAYARMARAAAIDVPATRLFETSDGRKHFAVERFDRTPSRGRRHVHTLGGLLGREAGEEGDYDELLRVSVALTASAVSREEVLRRLCFNLAALNDDDHLKNTAFLLEPTGEWRLAPAYDLTYSPSRRGERGMSVAGFEGDVTWGTVEALADRHSVKPQRMREIREEVETAIDRWPKIAASARVPRTALAELTAALETRRRQLRR